MIYLFIYFKSEITTLIFTTREGFKDFLNLLILFILKN